MSKKKNRRVLLIALIGLLPGLLFGCSPKDTIFGGRIMDGDGMINPFGPMLDALAGDWESGDGAWQAAIDGYSIKLLRGGTPVLDLDYAQDSSCDTDMNVVMTGAGHYVEVQGTAEGVAFSRAEMDQLLRLAEKGIGELIAMQSKALQK